jgi:hypothetical protein
MAHLPFHEKLKQLVELKSDLQDLKAGWLETLEDLIQAKDEIKSEDLFATLDYLAFCDRLCKGICLDLNEIDGQLRYLVKVKNKAKKKDKNSTRHDALITERKALRNNMQEQMQKIDEEYAVLAEETLGRVQDRIASLSNSLERRKTIPSLKTEISQNLDQGLFLQELKDSLESYREAREDFISYSEMNALQKLSEDRIPEDLGEEKPETDIILSQIDMAITACDSALLISEITDQGP